MVDNEADSVKVSESAEPPLWIFKVYIITIMGHLNIPLLSLLYRQKTDLPQDSMTPLSPFPMWNFLFFHMEDAFFFSPGVQEMSPDIQPHCIHLPSRGMAIPAEVLFRIRPPCPCKVLLLSPFLLLEKLRFGL